MDIISIDPDVGGGKGYSISFTDKDSYASIQNYFTPSNQWPEKAMTFSVWIRWVAVSPGGTGSFAFTVLAANDPNHVQIGLKVAEKENNWVPNVELLLSNLVGFTPVRNLNSLSSCWTHITMTFNLTGMWILSLRFSFIIILTVMSMDVRDMRHLCIVPCTPS